MPITVMEERRERIPVKGLDELGLVLDESVPLPRRVALFFKWALVFGYKPGLRIEDVTPSRLREEASHLLQYYRKYMREKGIMV